MALAVDHIFIACARGAPEAQVLVDLGLTEGSGNVHPGQGTANRRFFVRNFFLELLWVEDEAQARSPLTAPTRLWERCSLRDSACPFGIVLRCSDPDEPLPFRSWAYRPQYLPADMAIDMASNTPLWEPTVACLPRSGMPREPRGEPVDHRLPIRELSGMAITLVGEEGLSPAVQALESMGLVSQDWREMLR